MRMKNQGERLVHTSLVVVGLTCSVSLLAGCSKAKKAPSGAETTTGDVAASAALNAATSTLVSNAPTEAVVTSDGQEYSSLTANSSEPQCKSDADWTTLELKHLQDGRLELAKDTLTKPTLTWAPCDGDKPQCERLVLRENQSLLAIGSNGKTLKLAVSETCDNNTTVTIATPSDPASVVFRGVDMTFESAVIGGERLLLSGYARHTSEHAKEGYVPREYLVSVRETKTVSIEPARNKQKAAPVAAANQLVRVNVGDLACTTVFWKLGVEQCDFSSAPSDNIALFGSHLVYVGDAGGAAGTKGMAWSTTDGHRELLPKLEWIVTDGVNVAWSTGSELYTAQPRWDLPELKGKVVPGDPGARPIALGCGRSLTSNATGFALRNLATGSQWTLNADRFPEPVTAAVMNCDWLVSNNGYRTSLTNLGKASPLDGTTTTAASAAPSSEAAALPSGTPALPGLRPTATSSASGSASSPASAASVDPQK